MKDFAYFNQIEALFVKRRGKHLMVGPSDWALIDHWRKRNIPLSVVLRGIERTFNSCDGGPHPRTVNTIKYCEAAVEAEHRSWLNSRVGTPHDAGRSDEPDEENARSGCGMGSAVEILAYLTTARAELLREPRGLVEKLRPFAISSVLLHAAEQLEQLVKDVGATCPDPADVESVLAEIQESIDRVLLSEIFQDLRDSVQTEVEAQLGLYRSRMAIDDYRQILCQLVVKRLREHFELPTLSLFKL
jgi:hypothetical protein